MNKFEIITPKTKYINVKINDQKAKKYILQQKIDYKLLQDYNLNNGPILKYSDTEEKLYNLNNIDITNVDFLQIVKNSNDEYLNNKKNVHQLYSAIGKFNYKKYFNNYYNYKYEMLISLLDGCHGLSGNDPIFYFDIEKNKFKHIYYDGMFFENYDISYLCDDIREIRSIDYKEQFLEELTKKINNKEFKSKIFDEFKDNASNKSLKNFNFFWNKFIIKLEYIKNNKDIKKNSLKKFNKISVDDKLNNLNFHFPLVYTYSKSKVFYLCVKWPSNNHIKALINNKNQIINKNNFNNCQIIEPKMARLISLEKISFRTLGKNLKIYPVILGNINQESIFE